ncbi:uncharacterized protein [Watersipora subatra]|uniref:uncharacterized protein n=1 Tax=Watersipora subatra TaxID=2589382 RepID=UPI00355C789D
MPVSSNYMLSASIIDNLVLGKVRVTFAEDLKHSTTLSYRHSGKPEWNGELRDLVCKHRDDEQEIKTDIGEHHITHLTINGDCHLSLVDIAPHMTHLRLRNTSAVKSLKTFTTLKKLELCRIDLSLEWPSLPANSLEELRVIDCKMKTLPSWFEKLNRLKVLRISCSEEHYRSLQSIPELVTKLTSLEVLDLSNNGVRQIPDSLGSLTLLRELNLSRNPIEVLPESITALSSLEKLDLSSCEISQLPDSLIQLQKLKVLRITGYSELSDDMFTHNFIFHGLQTFPEVVTKLTSLEELDLSGNRINELPDSFIQLQKLKVLRFTGYSELSDDMFTHNFIFHGLQTFPEVVTKLTSLEELDLSGNRINELPDSFIQLQKLKVLKISDYFEPSILYGLHTVPEVVTKLTSLEELDLSCNWITGLPDSFIQLQKLKVLKISGYFKPSILYGLHTVPEVVTKLTSLEELDLSCNPINELPDSFIQLQKLKVLRITGNSVLSIPFGLQTVPEVVTKLTSLEELDLSNNRINELPDSLGSLKSLRKLNLSGKPIEVLPESITSLSSLEELDLSWCKINQLPESLGSLTLLRKLNVSSNPIEVLPEYITSLSSLEELDLSHCKISQLPESLGSLTSLRKLKLNINHIKVLPESITALSSLEELNLSVGKISQLPESLGSLESLRKLDLFGNPFEVLSESITALSSLEELDLSHCKISQLPESLGSLKSLRKLNLSGNPIEVLPESITSLSSLEELDLSHCKISQLPESLGSLTSLRKLDLNRNPIEVLPESITALSSLKELNLSECKISQLPDRYNSLQMLRCLSLAFNNIQSLPFWIYKLERLEELDLKGNTKLEKIESAVLKMKSLVSLDCARCENLKEPPYSVCIQGIKAIRKFFVDLAADKPVKLVEVPVAVVGNTLSGKTSLFRTLKTGKRVLTCRGTSSEKDETTRVFQVEDLPLEATEVKLFDYGGNQVYHLAYQILSKERCIPMMVVDLADFAKRAQANGAEAACKKVCFNWLSHLYLACPKLGPPILVLTHVDELASDQLSQAREEFLNAVKSIRLKLLEKENQFASLFPKVLNVIEHLSNRQRPLFDDGEIFEFGNDPKVTSNIEHLKKKLNERCKEHIVELPKLWNSVVLFIQQASHEPYVELSQVLKKFPDDDLVIILRYMHNAGRVFFFEKLKGLSGYIFHKFNKITSMINLLFHHRSQKQWDDHLSEFDSFLHQDRVIHQLEYEALVQRLLHDGILAEALLKNLLSGSDFPFDVSVELLRSFLMMHGPIGKPTHAEFLVPALASESMEDVANMKNRLQLRVDILLEGLPIPTYVHHQLSVAVLNLLCNPVCRTSAFKSGVTIAQKHSVTYVQHNFHKGVITVRVATIPKELSTSWQRLIDVTDVIIRQLSQSWKACHVAVRIYCSHCLFRGDQQPEFQVNPEWLCSVYEATGEATLKVSTFSGIEPVICKQYSTSPSNVLLPLKFPCIQLTDNEVTAVDNYLSNLEHCQASSAECMAKVQSPVIDPDSELSDVEKEGYCDEKKSQQKIALRLIPTSKKSVKYLFENTNEVYKMSEGVRGRVLIFNIKTFRHTGTTRDGSEVDYDNLRRLLKDLKFDVAKTEADLTDLSFEEILKEIKEETKREEHKDLGMFILIIMSHGFNGDMLLDHHGDLFPLASIRDSLSPEKFPAMAGKPKLIIVQACSGVRSDFGRSRDSSGGTKRSSDVARSTIDCKLLQSIFWSGPNDEQKPPSDPPTVLNVDDFFIMKASSESYSATKSDTHGSFFIRMLVVTFYKHACHRDVESLFKIIQDRVRQISLIPPNHVMGGNVPTSICTFTHRRKLYLFPGFRNR